MTTPEQKTILLVEDEAIIAIAEARTIKQFGYDVIVANSGEKAIALATADDTTDLILMDIDLGKGINGPGAALQILKRRSLPIVFLTSHSEREMVEKVRGITRYGYVIKNSGDFVLQSSIEMALELFDAHRDIELKMEALREGEEQFRNLWGATVEGIAILDRGLVVEVNDAMCRMFGYMRKQVIGKSLLDFAPAEMHDQIRERIVSGVTGRFETPALRADGAKIILEVFVKQIFYHGKPVRMAATRDITERKRAEEESSRLASVIRHSLELVNLATPDGMMFFLNDAGKKMLGISEEDVAQTTLMRVIPDHLVDKVRQEVLPSIVADGNWEGDLQYLNLETGGLTDVHAITFKITDPETGALQFMANVSLDITERKRAEKELHESEERFRTIWDKSIDGMRLLDSSGTISMVNAAFCRFVGKKRTELEGQPLDVMYDPIEGEQILETAVERIRTKTVLPHIESHVALWDNRKIWVEVSNSHIELGAGQNFLLSIFRDITERKQVEDKLRGTEERLALALDQSHIASWEMDGATNTFAFNDRFYEIYATNAEREGGYKMPADVYAREFLLPHEQHIVPDDVARLMTGEISQLQREHVIKRRDGELRNIVAIINVVRDAKGIVIGTRGSNQDITERKQAEEVLRQSEERYRELIGTMQDGVYRSSHGGNFLEVNPAMVKILGYDSKEELLAIDIKKQLYFAAEDRESAALEETLEEMAVFRLKKKDGSEIWVEDHGRHIVDEAGNVLYHEGVLRDVTERKLAEEKIQHLLAEKELLLHEVHHRIKNNMTTMMALLRLQSDSFDDPIVKAAFVDSSARLHSMEVLYDKLYRSADLHGISIGEYLSSLADDVVKNYPNSGKVTIEKEFDDFKIEVKKLSPLGIIINELLTNVMKYAFEGRKNGVIKISATLKERQATIIVQDNGVGIPESVTLENSDSFGLKLVGILAEQIEGTIRIERGNGTKIALEFDV
ncbi:MAG: PAS domain S-box protein [Ignavibacteriales bacterium]|nr:PAS domain S-box protein [Ignavibacteriales bacterium]